jgi:hypothetical protein
VSPDELDCESRALALQLHTNGARLRAHAVRWLRERGASEEDAAAVIANAMARSWVGNLAGTNVLYPTVPLAFDPDR